MDSKNKSILEALQMQPLSEEEKAARHILGRLYGPIATTKEKTRNGRGYNKELWEKALADDIFKEKLATKSLFLELGHPTDREETDMKLVCACIPEMPKIVDGDLYAYVDILDTENGRLLKTLCDYGFVPGISSRGSGDIMANDEVDPDTFFLETWDIVAIPAVKKARLAMCESFDGKKSLKAVLQESYDKANDEEKQVMKETLNKLDIGVSITEEVDTKPEDIIYEDPEVSDNMLTENEAVIEDPTALVGDVVNETTDDSSEDEVDNPVADIAVEAEVKVEEPADTVGKMIDQFNEYDKDLKVEFKPIKVGENECQINGLLFDPAEEGKIIITAICTPVEGVTIEPEVSIEQPALEEPVIQSEEATDDGDKELLDSLKEMVRQKDLLESELKELKAQKTVSDAEVKGLNEDLNKYKLAYARVSEIASKANKFEKENKNLIESIAQKDTQITELNEKVKKHTNLTESIDAKTQQINELTEKLHAVVNESEETEKSLNEQIIVYRKKLAARTETARDFKSKYESVLEHYVDSKAKMLGVRRTDITSRLVENYSIDDVDKVCDEMLTESLGWSNLPFGMQRGTAKIQIKESKSNVKASNPDEGYEIDDDLLELAGLK